MAHEKEDEIKCPHCDTLYTNDSWEHIDYSGDTYTCESCDKDFILEVETTFTYSTSRVDCKDNKHEYGEPDSFIHKDGSRGIECKNCEITNYIKDNGDLVF